MFDTFGQALKFFRERDGLTQQELANQLNVSRTSVSHWERNIYPLKKREIILKLDEERILELSEDEVDLLLKLAGYSPKYRIDPPDPYSLENMPAANPGLVEAEHYHPLGQHGCTKGFWKTWAFPEFSNGLCINNEEVGGNFEQPLCLSFT